jgi:hypothetical protein
MSVSWPRAWRRLAVPAGSRRPARKPLMACCARRAAGVPSWRDGPAVSRRVPQPSGPPQWPARDGRGRLAGGRSQCGQRLARSRPCRRQKKVTGSDQAAGIWPGSSARQAGQNRVACCGAQARISGVGGDGPAASMAVTAGGARPVAAQMAASCAAGGPAGAAWWSWRPGMPSASARCAGTFSRPARAVPWANISSGDSPRPGTCGSASPACGLQW